MKTRIASWHEKGIFTPFNIFLIGTAFLFIVFLYQIGNSLIEAHNWQERIRTEQQRMSYLQDQMQQLEQMREGGTDLSSMLRHIKRVFSLHEPNEEVYLNGDSMKDQPAASTVPTLWQAIFSRAP